MDANHVRGTLLTLLFALATLSLAAPISEAATPPVLIGARIPGVPQNPGLIDAYTRAVGRPPAIVSYWREWGQTVFDRYSLQEIARRGAVPMITWEPNVPGWRRGMRSTILTRIVSGKDDGYIRRVARSVPSRPTSIFLRFAPEMNGTWYPWGIHVPGNSPALYVAAWRHVVRIFRAAGVRNVEWVWSPNVDDNGELPFVAAYPGDSWVDVVGLDGYNWGGNWLWQSFNAVFADSYAHLGRITHRPVMIAETGCGNLGGNKAAWIANTFDSELPAYTRVFALVWFNGVGETGANFRFNTSAASADAFRAALRSPRYSARGWNLSAAMASREPSVKIASATERHDRTIGALARPPQRWWIVPSGLLPVGRHAVLLRATGG